jgi:hypothetical protein
MALKGIDAQLMVTQTTQASRESSRMLHRGEMFQDYISLQARVESETDRERVARTIKQERSEFHPDDDGAFGAGGGEMSGGSSDDDGDLDADEYMVPGEEHIVDIRI